MGHHRHHHGRTPPPPPAPNYFPPIPYVAPAPAFGYGGTQAYGQPYPAPSGASVPYNYGNSMQPNPYGQQLVSYEQQQQQQLLNQAVTEYKRHDKNEHLGQMGAVAAGAFALYEKHEAKVDPVHARRHKMEAQLAGTFAAGSAAYAFHENREKKKSQRQIEKLNHHGHGHDKHHGLHFW